MPETSYANTSPLDLCWRCEAEVHEGDRFCRHCGANLSERTAPFIRAEDSKRIAGRDTGESFSPYETAPLSMPDWQRPISGKLVEVVAAGIKPGRGGYGKSRLVKGAMVVLITPPIWLLMVLLAPLDAYAVTKVITKRI
jgi:hypothetical protein